MLGVVAAQYDYDLPQSEEALRHAVAADPQYAIAHYNLAVVLCARAAFGEAAAEYATARQLDPVGFDITPIQPLLDFYARRYEDATAGYREILAVMPEAPFAKWQLRAIAGLQGAPESDPWPPAPMVGNYQFAAHEAQLGHAGEAMRLLRQSLEQRVPALVFIGVDPRFDSMRKDPRFIAFVRSVYKR